MSRSTLTKKSCFQPLPDRGWGEVQKHFFARNCMNIQICTEKLCSQPYAHEEEGRG